MALAVMALAGCASTTPVATLPRIEAPTAWLSAPEAATAARTAPERWWAELGDPRLDRLVERAQQSAPDLRTALARLREVRARRDQADANTAPSVTASGSASRSRSSAAGGRGSTGSSFDAGFDASWEIDVFGRLQAGVDAAEADLAAAQAGLGDAQASLRAEVARSYVELRSLQAREGIARQNLEIQSETLQITQWRVQAGLVSELDVEQARTNREQTRAQLHSLQNSAAQSQLRLELLLGVMPGALQAELQPAQALPSLPQRVVLLIPADVLRQRADVRAAGQQCLAEGARTAQARANLLPRLTLSGSIGLQALTLGTLADGGYASLLAGLTAPIFDAGRLRAQLQAQTAVQDRLAVAYEKAVLTALSDVQGALAALAAARVQADALAVAAESAGRAAQLARDRYDSGLIDFRAVLDAQRSLLSAQDGLASARADGLYAWIRLYKALGGGWDGAGRPDDTGKTS